MFAYLRSIRHEARCREEAAKAMASATSLPTSATLGSTFQGLCAAEARLHALSNAEANPGKTALLATSVETAVQGLSRAADAIAKAELSTQKDATERGPRNKEEGRRTNALLRMLLPQLSAASFLLRQKLSEDAFLPRRESTIAQQQQKEEAARVIELARRASRAEWEMLSRERSTIAMARLPSLLRLFLGSGKASSLAPTPNSLPRSLGLLSEVPCNPNKRAREGGLEEEKEGKKPPLPILPPPKAFTVTTPKPRSPSPPPSLRPGGKNSFSFSVRVNNTRSDGTQPTSPPLSKPPRREIGEKSGPNVLEKDITSNSGGNGNPNAEEGLHEPPRSLATSSVCQRGSSRFEARGRHQTNSSPPATMGSNATEPLTRRGGTGYDANRPVSSTNLSNSGSLYTTSNHSNSNNFHNASHPPNAATLGFVTAGEQLLLDIKAGRAGPVHASYLSNRSPALGLRRSGFQTPFQQQQQQLTSTNASNEAPTASPSFREVAQAVLKPPSSTSAAFYSKKPARAHPEDPKNYNHHHHNNNNNNNNRNPNNQNPNNSHYDSSMGNDTKDNYSNDNDNDAIDAGAYPACVLNPDGSVPDILKPLDPALVKQVAMEILEQGAAGSYKVTWDDIIGLTDAKSSVEEAIVWPLRRPDLFVGLRDPPRGLLLFGPPGTGKTMIARAIAHRAQCTFLNISSSSLMSKWVGDGEKLVRCLFAVAVVKQPSVIFIDEIDALLSMRGEGEMDAVRRVKTEFLVHLDGVATNSGDRVLLIGATNRPDELDEAARRRMEKRLYIPLPDRTARQQLIARLLDTLPSKSAENGPKGHRLTTADFARVAALTAGYSGADLRLLCREAAMGPLREMTSNELSEVTSKDLRPVDGRDFEQALKRIKTSVGPSEVGRYTAWNRQYGSFVVDSADDESTRGEDDTAL